MGHVMSIGGTTDYEDLNMKMRGIGKNMDRAVFYRPLQGFMGILKHLYCIGR